MFSDGITRGSGCVLQHCVYKTNAADPGKILRQALIMDANPAVYAPVLCFGTEGYVMPLGRDLRTEQEVQLALGRLADLWKISLPLRSDVDSAARNRAYHDYVMSRPADEELRTATDKLFQAVDGFGAAAQAVHGDATLENAVVFGDSCVRWVDPDTRDDLPLCAELDCAKLLQSVYGYSEIPAGAAVAVLEFIKGFTLNRNLLLYYLATHLVRLWSHQPAAKQAWALQICREVLASGNPRF